VSGRWQEKGGSGALLREMFGQTVS